MTTEEIINATIKDTRVADEKRFTPISWLGKVYVSILVLAFLAVSLFAAYIVGNTNGLNEQMTVTGQVVALNDTGMTVQVGTDSEMHFMYHDYCTKEALQTADRLLVTVVYRIRDGNIFLLKSVKGRPVVSLQYETICQ